MWLALTQCLYKHWVMWSMMSHCLYKNCVMWPVLSRCLQWVMWSVLSHCLYKCWVMWSMLCLATFTNGEWCDWCYDRLSSPTKDVVNFASGCLHKWWVMWSMLWQAIFTNERCGQFCIWLPSQMLSIPARSSKSGPSEPSQMINCNTIQSLTGCIC